MRLTAGGVSDVGMVRNANQDSWLVTDRLWAVADGMGGHQGGEVASQLTIEVLSENFDDNTATALVAAAQQANAAVYERASEYAELRGMGTTLCAMALVDLDDDTQVLDVINVGDSRCYRWRDGEMTQITRDHSLVEDMRAAGQLTDAEAAIDPHRNIVTRALGIQPEVRVDSFRVTPSTGDRYVLCSDGLFNEVPPDRIGATLRRLADPQEAAAELVRQANEAGGRDNVTCVVVDVVDAAGVSPNADGPDIVAERAPDVAGITTATPAAMVTNQPTDKRSDSTRGERKPDTPVRLRRATWRTLIFVLAFLVILAAVVGAIGWYAVGSYFVGLDRGEVTVFKGRPGGVLWFAPTVERRTGIAVAQVPAALRDDVRVGRQQPSSGAAADYIDGMRTMICRNLDNGARLPPLAPGAPTTTLPTACASPHAPPPTTPATTTTAPADTTVTR